MFRQLLRRFGVGWVSAGLTRISIAASLVITTLITVAMGSEPDPTGLTIAVVVPLVIAPVMSLQMLALLSRLDQAEERLRALSITDELTQAYNRRYFITLAETEPARVRRHGGACSLAILDLDNFKDVNDSLGHLAGDEVLRQFTRVCRDNLRAGDTVARYGGDEFIVLLPGASPQMAHEVVERIRVQLATAGLAGSAGSSNGPRTHARLSLSAGIASLDPAAPDLDQLVKRADDALYAAKHAGGNQVICEAG